MKVTVGQMLHAAESGAFQRLSLMEVAPDISFLIVRLIRKVQPEVDLAREAKLKLFTEENSFEVRGPGVEKGTRRIRDEFREDYESDLKPILEHEIEIPAAPVPLG